MVFAEPALDAAGSDVYLATLCLARGTVRVGYVQSRTVLLRRTPTGYAYLGVPTDYADAQALGDSLEQIAISDSIVPGRIVVLVTPIDHQATPPHQGCVGLELLDLATATMARDAEGALSVSARIRAAGDQLGPGLCDYDSQSSTGVLLTIPKLDASSDPAELRIAVHATGVML